MSKGKKRLVPVRRFKEFENSAAWEQRRLGEVSKITAGGDVDKGKILPRGKFPVIANALTNAGIVGYYNDTYRIKAPAVTVTGRGEIGKAKARKDNFTPVVRLLAVESRHDVDFLAEAINKSKVVFESTGVPQLTVPKLSSYEVLFPNSIDEEIKIGDFLKQFDSLIELCQRKLDKLKRIKSAYLTEMFPAEGECEPKRRFPGFTGAWEQRKLGEVADIVGGGTPSTKVKEYWNGNINWYSPVEIGTSIYTSESVKKITQLGLEKSSAKILPKGTVLFTSRAGIGNTAILTKEATTNQGFQSIVPKKGLLNSYFIFTETPFLKRYGETNGAGSTFVEVSGKQMLKMPLQLPSFDEQLKIGNFFKQLDSLIALHQRKLDKLKKLKAAYLNEMFV